MAGHAGPAGVKTARLLPQAIIVWVHRIRTWAACALALAGCAPSFNWRELTLPDTGLKVSFPCRPASHARSVPLAGVPRTLTLHACEVQGVTFAVAWVDVGDPARTNEVLSALSAAAAANLGAASVPAEPFGFPGITPYQAAGQMLLRGRVAEGRPGLARVAVFAVGARAFQATALGESLPSEPVAQFFGSIGTRP